MPEIKQSCSHKLLANNFQSNLDSNLKEKMNLKPIQNKIDIDLISFIDSDDSLLNFEESKIEKNYASSNTYNICFDSYKNIKPPIEKTVSFEIKNLTAIKHSEEDLISFDENMNLINKQRDNSIHQGILAVSLIQLLDLNAFKLFHKLC